MDSAQEKKKPSPDAAGESQGDAQKDVDKERTERVRARQPRYATCPDYCRLRREVRDA